MLKIISLSDLHNAIDFLEPLAEALSSVDLVLFAGDLTNAGKAKNASEIIEVVRKYNKSILAIPGNWDGHEVNNFLESEGISLHRKHIIFNGTAFLGVGGSLFSGINTPNEISETDFNLFLDQANIEIEDYIPKVLV